MPWRKKPASRNCAAPPATNRPYRAPEGREEELAAVFRDVLGIDRIGLDDDFFELGGDSLASVELITAINDHFGVELSASVVLRVTNTDPGVRGDRVSGALKPATLETGLVVQVPLFVEEGDLVKVDTRSGEYLTREK